MSDELEPLWSNQRIRDRYHALVPCEANMGEMEYWNVLRDVGERVSYELRNDYEARIAELEQEQIALWHTINTQATYAEELEAQLAQRWEPLPDGAYGASNDIIVAGQHLCMFVDGGDVGDNLPPNIRLCRLVERGEAMPPDVRATLRDVLEAQHEQSENYASVWGEDSKEYAEFQKEMAAIDAALSWLDAQDGTP